MPFITGFQLMPQQGAGEGFNLHSSHHLRAISADDADEHANNLTDWQQQYDQVSAGAFRGTLLERHQGALQLFCEATSQAVRQSCCVPPGSLWLGLPVQVTQGIRINGRQAPQYAFLTRPGGVEFELITPAAYAIYGIVVPKAALMQLAAQLGCQIDWALLGQQPLWQASPQAYQRCCQLLARCLDPAADSAPPDGAVLSFVLDLLDQAQVDALASRSLARRQQLVAAARARVLADPQQASIAQLCQQLNVSRRTLQYCFETVTGQSPLHYLRALRLNAVRRALLRGEGYVTEVAAAWGFEHPSQFASDYRQLFGCLPSQTREVHLDIGLAKEANRG